MYKRRKVSKIDFEHLVKGIFLSDFILKKGIYYINLLYSPLLYRTQKKKGMRIQEREGKEWRMGGEKTLVYSFLLFL